MTAAENRRRVEELRGKPMPPVDAAELRLGARLFPKVGNPPPRGTESLQRLELGRG